MAFLDLFRRKNKLSMDKPSETRTDPIAQPVTRDSPTLDFWVSHPGYGATPREIVNTYRSAEAGFLTTQCDLFDDIIESDGHLRACLDQRVDDVGGKDWIIQPGAQEPASVRAAAVLEAALRDVPNFTDTIEHQLSSLRYGYAGAEVDAWEMREGYWVPTWFRMPRSRRFRLDKNGTLRILTDKQRTEGEALEPGRWWVTALRGPLATASPMRTCAWWALFKRMSVRDWVVFSERFGLPYVTGQYGEGATPEDKSVLTEAVQALGKDGAAVFSEACRIVVTETKGGDSNSVHANLTSLCEAQISKLLLGGTLTMGEGSSTGSYALGQVHQARSFALTVADAARLSRSFGRDIGRTFNRFNGISGPPPALYVHIMPELDALARANLADIAMNKLGMELDEEQLRREWMFKRPAPGRALRATPAAPAPFAPAPEPQPSEDEPEAPPAP